MFFFENFLMKFKSEVVECFFYFFIRVFKGRLVVVCMRIGLYGGVGELSCRISERVEEFCGFVE